MARDGAIVMFTRARFFRFEVRSSARRSFVGQKIGWTPVRVNRTPGPLSPYRFEACTQGHSGSVRQVQPRSWPLKVGKLNADRSFDRQLPFIHAAATASTATYGSVARATGGTPRRPSPIHRSRTVWAAPWLPRPPVTIEHTVDARPPGGAMLAATRTFARVRAASAPEAAISLRRFAAPAGPPRVPRTPPARPRRGVRLSPPPPRSAIDPPLSPPLALVQDPPRLAVPPLTPPLLVPPPRRVAQPPTRRRSPPTSPPRRRLPADPPRRAALAAGSATIVRETYEGVSASYSVSHGDTLRGYPTMTLREMLASVDARYAAGAMPAERHAAQLVDKVADADDAAKVAGAMAKFRASRLSRVSSGRSSPGTTLRRDGYLGSALLMFISACARDSADPRRAMDVAVASPRRATSTGFASGDPRSWLCSLDRSTPGRSPGCTDLARRPSRRRERGLRGRGREGAGEDRRGGDRRDERARV